MADEPDVLIPDEEPRLCPSCGTRVAAMATTCLMCGASLDEEAQEAEAEAAEGLEEIEPRSRLPKWTRPFIVVALAALILVGGFYGLYALMRMQPEDISPTATPTPTPTPTATPTPTSTPRPTTTPTPIPPLAYQVQPGDTLSAIAARYGITVENILALNPGVEPEALQVGNVLRIPSGTLTPTPTPTLDPSIPTPTPGNYVVHIVQSGDTLTSIAEQYEVSEEIIQGANPDVLPVGSDSIFAGQSLVVPLGTPEPTIAPTDDPNATPTPLPPYEAPALLYPPDETTFAEGEFPIALQWVSVGVLSENEWYQVTLTGAGGVVSTTFRTQTTAWRPPFDLLAEARGKSPVFRWQVQVVREVPDGDGGLIYEAGGVASERRTFQWVKPTPTPPIASPTP